MVREDVGVKAFTAANEALRFLLELCMLAAFAYWGSKTGGSTAINVVLAIVTPLAAATIWGVWCAPRSDRRLPPPRRIPLELLLFALAAVALAAAGATTLAIVFAIAVAVNTLLLHAGSGEI
jgi:hypothetical protein